MKTLGMKKVVQFEAALLIMATSPGCGPALAQYFAKMDGSLPSAMAELPVVAPNPSQPGSDGSSSGGGGTVSGGGPSSTGDSTGGGSTGGGSTGGGSGPGVNPTPTATPTATPTTPVTDPGKTVCDPFGDAGAPVATSSDHGIVALLKYIENGVSKNYSSVNQYAQYGSPVDGNFYFSQMNVPTRYFSDGFQNQNGASLTKPDGSLLMEYFYLHFDSQLKLPAGQGTKKFQFALIADDGAILSMDQGSGFKTVVNNDGTHATQMGCATSPVTLSDSSMTPIKVDYYQGPRYNIALMLMYREWSSSNSFKSNDPMCGQTDNGLFFDYSTTPSTPKKNYQDLLNRGWKVVPSEMFYLPTSAPPVNPCTVGDSAASDSSTHSSTHPTDSCG